MALDPSTRSLLVEIDLPNPDHALRPGTFVEMSLGLREIPNALVLPPQAVISGPKGKSVFIIEAGHAKSVPVQTGISDGRWIEITSGLAGDEDVVVVGKRKLVEGSPVTPAPFNLPEAKPPSAEIRTAVAGISRPASIDFRNSNAQESQVAVRTPDDTTHEEAPCITQSLEV